jgi:hypothetical protein
MNALQRSGGDPRFDLRGSAAKRPDTFSTPTEIASAKKVFARWSCRKPSLQGTFGIGEDDVKKLFGQRSRGGLTGLLALVQSPPRLLRLRASNSEAGPKLHLVFVLRFVVRRVAV